MASVSQFQKLVSRNQDIAKLVEKGYAITFDSGWMILRDIPHLDQQGVLHWGLSVRDVLHVPRNPPRPQYTKLRSFRRRR